MINFDTTNFNNLPVSQKHEQYEYLKEHIEENVLKTLFFKFITKENLSTDIVLDSAVTQEDIALAYDLFSKDRYQDVESLSVLKKMVKDLSSVSDSLQPLNTILDMNFEIGLVGGALKQMLLDTTYETQEIDVVFALNGIRQIKGKSENLSTFSKNEVVNTSKEISLDNLILEKERISSVFKINLSENKDSKILFKEIVKYLLERDFKVEEDGDTFILNCRACFYRVRFHLVFEDVLSYMSHSTLDKIYIVFDQDNIEDLNDIINFFQLEKLIAIYQTISVRPEFFQDIKKDILVSL